MSIEKLKHKARNPHKKTPHPHKKNKKHPQERETTTNKKLRLRRPFPSALQHHSSSGHPRRTPAPFPQSPTPHHHTDTTPEPPPHTIPCFTLTHTAHANTPTTCSPPPDPHTQPLHYHRLLVRKTTATTTCSHPPTPLFADNTVSHRAGSLPAPHHPPSCPPKPPSPTHWEPAAFVHLQPTPQTPSESFTTHPPARHPPNHTIPAKSHPSSFHTAITRIPRRAHTHNTLGNLQKTEPLHTRLHQHPLLPPFLPHNHLFTPTRLWDSTFNRNHHTTHPPAHPRGVKTYKTELYQQTRVLHTWYLKCGKMFEIKRKIGSTLLSNLKSLLFRVARGKMKTISQAKDTIRCLITIWCTNLFLCLTSNEHEPDAKLQQWTRNGKSSGEKVASMAIVESKEPEKGGHSREAQRAERKSTLPHGWTSVISKLGVRTKVPKYQAESRSEVTL